MHRIYLQCIQPVLDYAISIWGHCNESYKGLIVRIQHRAARIVSNEFDYINVRGEELMNQLRWQTLDQRRDYFTATLMFKCLNNDMAPAHLRNEVSLSSEIHDVQTRFALNHNVAIPKPNIEIYKKSFKYHGSLIWNALPSELKHAGDLREFKGLYKRMYF